MEDFSSPPERAPQEKMSPQYKELVHNRNIPHAVVMREYGFSRCPSHLSSEFRIAAEEQLIKKKKKEMKCELPDFTRSTYLMVFSPDGKKMASSHGNHNVYVTDVKTGKNLNTLTGHPRTPWCIAFHPSSNQILASGCLGGQVRVWDLHGGSEVWTVEGQTSIASLAFHPSDRLLVIASYNEIYFWDWSQPEPFARCCTLNEKEKIRYVAFDHSGSKLVTGIEIPKPIVSQWDRVGSGGQVNRTTGLGGPRSGVQRPFGPRYNEQLRQLLLRSAQNELNISTSRRLENNERRNLSNAATSVGSTSLRNDVNQVNSSEDRVNTHSSSQVSGRSVDLLPESFQERRDLHQRTPVASGWNFDTVQFGLGSERLNSTRPTVIRNLASQSSFHNSPAVSITHQSSFRDILSNSLHSEHSSDSSTSEQERRDENRSFLNLGHSPGISSFFRNGAMPSTSFSRVSDLRNRNSSRISRQSSPSYIDSDLTNQFNHPSEEIRRTLYTLSEHIDEMQHCSVCLPRMTNSRLSHIQQLWAELRDQIRSLQSSILENTNLASTAWHRSSFEVITEMLSHLTHGGEDGPSVRTSESSSNSRQTSQANPRSTSSNSWTSSVASRRLIPSTQLRSSTLFSRGETSSSSSSQPAPTANASHSAIRDTSTPLNSRSASRGNINRSLMRPNQTRRLLYLKCQNGHSRRLGTTAGLLRVQRTTPLRLTQPSCLHNGEETSERSPSNSGAETLGSDRSETAQSEEQTANSELEPDLSHRGEDSIAGNNEIQLSSNGSQSSNSSTITNPSSIHGHQLLKHRLFLGRRRNANSRIFRNSLVRGAHRPTRTTPPRFFGGRRSLLEVSVDHGASQPQTQPPRNNRASNQSSVRTSDNMLMRIFRSLRRAATLSGRSDRQSLQQDRSSHVDGSTTSRQSPHHHRLLPPNTSSELQEQSGLTSGPNQRPTLTDLRQQHENPSPGLRLWTQYSGPDGDVLHIRHPHLERVDPAVQERLLRIRSSGTMNIVQDGVMTEELARNLLRLHLHQQHQELQLQQHRARLRVRFHHQNALRIAVQRDVSRRHARCTLCGGSVFISSHFLVRVGSSTQDPQPAHTSSNDPPVWQRWAAASPSSQPPAQPPPPPPPPPPLPAHIASSPSSSSSSFWQRETQESSHSPERTNSPPIPALQEGQIVQMPTVQEPFAEGSHPAHPPLQPPLVRSNVFFEDVENDDLIIIHSPPPQPSPPPDSAAVSSISVLSPPLQQINPRPDSMRSGSGVISPPQLLLGFPPSPPLLTPPSLPSPTLLSSSSSISPPPPPPLPPPPPPLMTSPMMTQVSTQTTPRYFDGNSVNGPSRLSSQRIDYTGSASLFWQVPASHHRHHTSPLSSPGRPRGTQINQRQQSSMFNPSTSSLLIPSAAPNNPEALNTSQISLIENLPTDLPSTSSGIGAGNGGQEVNKPHIPQVLGDSSSSDSETEGLVAHLRNRKKTRYQSSKSNGEQETKAHSSYLKSVDSDDGHSCINDREPSTSSNSLLASCDSSNKNQSLKRKVVDSSEQDGTSKVKTTNEPTSSTHLESLETGEADRGTSKRSKGSNTKTGEKKKRPETLLGSQTNVQGEAASSSLSNQNLEPEPLNSGPEVSPLQQLPEPTFTRQLEAITGRLDHLMFLQRNALDPSQRNRNGLSPDNSPLRNAGDPSHSSQEHNGSSDAINITSRLLTRLTESLSRQIQMVQQVRGQQGDCTEHQESPSRSGAGVQSNFTMINNTRRRGQELLSLMADSLSTFSSHNGLPEDFRSNPTFDHVQTISAAFWLLQGLYILLHLALELTDLLLTHFVSSYEPSDPEEGSPIPQPCVCLNSGATSSSPLLTRLPNASSHVWNGSNSPVGSSNPRPFGPSMMNSVYDPHPHRSSTRIQRPPFTNSSHRAQPNTNEATSLSSFSAVRRPRLVNLHNVFTSARPHIRSPPVLESYFRSRRNLQNESPSVVQIPVMPVPSYTQQAVNNEPPSEGWHPPTTYAVVHPIASTGTIRRSASQAPRTSFAQYFQQSENIIPPAGHIRPGFMRLRSRLLHPPLLRQQERPSPSSDADTSAQQSLFFHYDYTRNIGHFVREPNFTTEEHRIHRIQLWDFSKGDIPDISDGDENVVVAECKIHNDASVDISADGHLLVALLPAPRPTANPYLPTSPPGQTIGVYSLVWDSLGQLLYTTNLDQPAVSVALSPSAAYLLVGLATRRAMLPMPSDQNALAQIFRLEGAKPGRPIGARGRLNFTRNIEAQNDNVSVGINCIRWAPVSGQGIVYGTNTGSLVMLH